MVRAAAAHLGNSSCCFGGDGRLPDADLIAEGFLSASSLCVGTWTVSMSRGKLCACVWLVLRQLGDSGESRISL